VFTVSLNEEINSGRSKAPEHRRTPKRKREWSAELAVTLWSAAPLRRFSWDETCQPTFFV
jgi:hypothetical protein